MFKGASIGTEALIGSLVGEAATGQVELLLPELLIGGLVFGIKKGVEHHREKKQNQRDQASAKAAADLMESTRQMNEEVARSKAAREAAQAEAARIEAEKQAEIRRAQEAAALRQQNIAAEQTALNQARINQNQADIQRAQHYVAQEQYQMESEREARIRIDIDNAQPWLRDGSVPQPSSFDQAMAELNNRYGHVAAENDAMMQRMRIGPYFNPQRQGLNPPDRDPFGENPGGGGGMPGGGPGRGNDDYQEARNQERRNDLYNSLRNPAFDLLKQISDAIINQKNKEKESVQKADEEEQFKDDQVGNPPIIGGNPATWSPGEGSWTYDPQQPVLGGDPATWSPVPAQEGSGNNPATQGDNYPGKNGSGTLNPQPIQQETKSQSVLDNQHLIQEEIAALIAQQGSQELTEEEQLAQLNAIDSKLDTITPKQVKLSPGSIYSQQIQKF